MTEHPADLVAQAQALELEADQLAARARASRAQAAKLRSRAQRLNDPERGVTVRRAPVKPDELLAAAALACEDLAGTFQARDLARALSIADERRAGRLLLALSELGHVTRQGEGWASVDPEEARVRDYVIAAREFSIADAIKALAMPELTLAHYLDHLRERKLIEGAGGQYRYIETGPELVITEYPRHRPPEKEPPAGTEILSPRGIQQRVDSQAQRRQALSQPGVRLRVKNKERARERMETAKSARAEAQRAKARAQNNNGKRRRK